MIEKQKNTDKDMTINDYIVKFTETQPLKAFIILLVLGLIFGSLLFALLLIPASDWVYIKLSASDAGSFLQGAWGTAGSLAASFVAIVLAQQALLLTRRQNDNQTLQDDRDGKLQEIQDTYKKDQDQKTMKLREDQIAYQKDQDQKALELQQALTQLQREQNLTLQQNTPEYQIAYRAAMSSTKLDSLQIIIGSMERKKFRGTQPTNSDILKQRESVGDEFEIKREIKEELLGSRYIGFAADIAEKMYGLNKRLEIEALASELIVSTKPSLDKLLINQLNKTIHELVSFCMSDIQKVLTSSNESEVGHSDPNVSPDIFRFLDYEKSKNLTDKYQNGISKSVYYFVNVLFAQMRVGGYSYGEKSLLATNITSKMLSTNEVFCFAEKIPSDVRDLCQGFCVVTPFDFQRQTLLVDLEFPNRESNSGRRNIVESFRGRPDQEVMNAINNTDSSANPIVFLDQIESAQDSIQKKKWITFTEHLALWEGMRNLSNLLDAEEHHLEQAQQNFIDYVRSDIAEGLTENETNVALLEKIIPRYWRITSEDVETALGRMSNYEVVFRQALSELKGIKIEETTMRISLHGELRYFIDSLLQLLKAYKPSSPQKILVNNDSFQNLLKEHDGIIDIIHELAKRPFFERPFYGWILPDYGLTCSLVIAKNKPIGFIGVHYLLESVDDLVFKPNLLFKWLTSPNSYIDKGIRKSVAVAV